MPTPELVHTCDVSNLSRKEIDNKIIFQTEKRLWKVTFSKQERYIGTTRFLNTNQVHLGLNA